MIQYKLNKGTRNPSCHYKCFLNQASKDRFVCGMASDSMKILPLENDLTLENATELVLGIEAADKDAMTMQTQNKMLIMQFTGNKTKGIRAEDLMWD